VILKLVVVPLLFVITGLVLLGIAMLAPARAEARPTPPPPVIVTPARPASERIRGLERMSRGSDAVTALRQALEDPDPQVAAVAAILLRDCGT
jgi:hypothetical protein